MFETTELGRKVDKKTFEAEEQNLRTELLAAQRAAHEAGIPVIVVVSGVEGAGKGAVVNRLTTWLDTRLMGVHVFWDETDEERERPYWWRFWRTLPPRGTVGVLFGSWYTDPIVKRAFDQESDAQFNQTMHRIKAFERMLTQDGALFVKFWYHLSKDAQKAQYEADAKAGRAWATSPLTEEYGARYDTFREVSEQAIRLTDTGFAPWYLVEAEDARYRDLTTGRTLLAAIRSRLAALEQGKSALEGSSPTLAAAGDPVTVLERVDLDQQIKGKAYRSELEEWQQRLHELSWESYKQRRSTVAVFEGWDAAGKGGSIRRIVSSVDARLYKVISVAAPTDEERAQHYLWRFWRHLPRAGRLTIYDRSWYGRVLVERVEGFASHEAWSRSYHEINEFESQLIEAGTNVAKFWLHISPEEQLERFEERKRIPWKQHKITEEDWRNRDRWDDYRLAINDMVQRTSTARAKWNIVPANDKKFARVFVLKALCEAMEKGLG